jgi:moderate conductance mechanosensitive channel
MKNRAGRALLLRNITGATLARNAETMPMKNARQLRLLPTVAIALFCLVGVIAPAAAAERAESIVVMLPADLTPEQREVLVEALGRLARPVEVEDAGAPALEDEAVSDLALVIGRFDDAMLAVGQVPALLSAWWVGLTGTGGLASFVAMLAGIVALAGGLGIEYVVDRLLAGWRNACLAARTTSFSTKLGYALGWFSLEILGLLVFGLGALLVGWLILPDTRLARLTLAVAVLAVIRVRLLLALGHLVFAPRTPNLRMIDLPDRDAKLLWRWILVIGLVGAAAFGVRDVLVVAGATADATAFLGIAAALVLLVSRIVAFIRTREPVRGLIRRSYGRPDGTMPRLARWFAEIWHLVFVAIAVLAFFGQLYAELAGGEGALASASFGPLLMLGLLPFVLGAYRALIDDLIIERATDTRHAVIGDVVKTLGQGAIVLIVFVFLATAWGANPFAGAEAGFGGRIARAVFDAGAAILVGWAIWQGVKVLLEHYRPEDDSAEASDEGMGKPGSRIATLLPVIRSFLFVTILTISAMTALAALGVNIGPLLAGAGVLGLAIGFGAQTLVKDVITGLFFLLEDAFRKGEYIETSAGKGVVEKISMRSVQLRHHRGPLYTIAFGQMGNIVNHSRDWVKIKFELRVPFDTDLELVRKVIKRVGEEIQADAELGSMILQPVKSQGVTQVDDSGFVIGVKFTSRPGEQFMVRREAYARIKKAFVENGIEFASRRVTVDSDAEASRAAAAGIAVAGSAASG